MKQIRRLIAACAVYVLFASVLGWTNQKNAGTVGSLDETQQIHGYSNDPFPPPPPPK